MGGGLPRLPFTLERKSIDSLAHQDNFDLSKSDVKRLSKYAHPELPIAFLLFGVEVDSLGLQSVLGRRTFSQFAAALFERALPRVWITSQVPARSCVPALLLGAFVFVGESARPTYRYFSSHAIQAAES
jgi:hypothetical protein